MQDLPPEILHITEGFQSLGTLVERVSQECFNSLSEVVEELAAIPVHSQTPMSNGIGNHALVNGVGNMTKENVRKKELMLEFAHQHRTRFIKLLVLSQWSQHAKDMSQLIDLRVWFNKQIEQYESAAYELGFFKTAIHPFKLPSPDMQTALNVLSTGKVPWTPDVRFNTVKWPNIIVC
jgi:mediator of RNA polymerase II transcription subunit 14